METPKILKDKLNRILSIMGRKLKKTVWLFTIIILPVSLYAQDITQFLDISVDGYKPEMIQKLKSKGFTVNRNKEDVLDGEFNGTDVNLFIGTNNNKVWRIAVLDINPTDETNIKIRFNNLIRQFTNNNRYSKQADSTVGKYTIPKDEDISHEIKVNKKRYEAVFYQKSLKSDSLNKEYESLIKERDYVISKDTLNNKEKNKVYDLIQDLIIEKFNESLNSLNKQVWFMINENYGKYRIVIYYENGYNKANGNNL